MSDLIDFDSPNPRASANPTLAAPLIPSPEPPPQDDDRRADRASEAGPCLPISPSRRSFDNNPFDVIMKKVTEYERNREDPFEIVVEKAEAASITSNRDDLVRDEGEQDISIITDLNNTNLIADRFVDGRRLSEQLLQLRCSDAGDDKKLPVINVTPANDLSILNNSAMNDSLLGCSGGLRRRSASQKDFTLDCVLSPQRRDKRSVFVTDSMKCHVSDESSSLGTFRSSDRSDDPFNDGFRKSQLLSGDSSLLSDRLRISLSKDRIERLNSDSSVFSGLSNVSSIRSDFSGKGRQDRFYSDGSAITGLSNLSSIPSSATSFSDLSTSSHSTMNKAFVNSRSALGSVSFSGAAEHKTPQKSNDKSDLIKKFYEIKKRMSSQVDLPSNEDGNDELANDKINSTTKSDKHLEFKSVEKLVDVNASSNSVFSDSPGVNDIIINEAKALAETFEKLASSRQSDSNTDDDLLLSKSQLNFDELPLSDDEAVDNLIDLPKSPTKNVDAAQTTEKVITNAEATKSSVNNDIKELESEFIDQTDSIKKKAMATSLLLDLQKIINKEDNPQACKVLKDLQTILGIKCDDNTEILKNCLQSSSGLSLNDKNIESEPAVKKNDNHSEKNDFQNLNNNEDCKKDIESKEEDKDTEGLEAEPETNSEDQKLAKNLLSTLNKMHKKDENNVVDFLSSLGSILSMATELRTKNKEPARSEEEETAASDESPSKESQNKSFQASSQRKSRVSLNKSSTASIDLDVSSVGDKKKMLLMSSRRYQSDQNLLEKRKVPRVVIDGKKPQVPAVATASIRAKFKKTSSNEAVVKKGPLKAMIPLGSMQKQASINQKASLKVTVTPPKSNSASLNIPSSTPNVGRSCKISKSSPKASSTPNALFVNKPEVATERRSISRLSKNFRSSSADNLSMLNSSLRRSGSLKMNKRPSQLLSPQKKQQQAPKSNAENGVESRLPRYSPRPVRVRNHSFSELRTAGLKSPTKLTEKSQRHSVFSPLRNCNKLEQRPKNLLSRFGRSGVQTGPEKENYV